MGAETLSLDTSVALSESSITSRVTWYLVVAQLPLTPEPPDSHETVALVPSELTATLRLMGVLGLVLGVAVGVAVGVSVVVGVDVALADGSGV